MGGTDQGAVGVVFKESLQGSGDFLVPGEFIKGMGLVIERVVGQKRSALGGLTEIFGRFFPVTEPGRGDADQKIANAALGGFQCSLPGIFILFCRKFDGRRGKCIVRKLVDVYTRSRDGEEEQKSHTCDEAERHGNSLGQTVA
jgi:hypothetical protein